MSKLSEGAKLKTDDERKAWFLSLLADEQAEVIAEMNIFLGGVREIFEPIAAAVVEWWKTAAPIFMKILESLPAEGTRIECDYINDGDATLDNRGQES